MPDIRKNVRIAEWRDGDQVQGFAFLAVKELRQDRSGSSYLHLELRDQSGHIQGKAWSDSPALDEEFGAQEYVAFEGLVQSYRGQLQLNVRRCRRAREEDRRHGFDESGLVPSTKEDLEELWQRLRSVLGREVRRPELSRLASHTLEAHGGALREHPAAKAIHHAYRGGLLEHVVSMLELGASVCDHYPDVDRDLVLLGILYHDLGKLLELAPMPAAEYTPVGRLVGHVVLGRDLLREACAAVGDVPAELQLHLEHLILAHQGRREWGSPVEPMTPEALIVHFVDDLDSKLAQLRQAQEQGGGFRFLKALGRMMFFRDEEAAALAELESERAAEDEEPAAEEPGLPSRQVARTLFD